MMCLIVQGAMPTFKIINKYLKCKIIKRATDKGIAETIKLRYLYLSATVCVLL